MPEAKDLFERYFAEKLWEIVPAIYRDEDGRAENPGVLRALVEILANEAAVLRRSHDRLWDDQFVDLADDWAVAYLADLVGTRLVSALNARGRRVDVAKTIYFRRRKGTLAVLEELISDIAGWEGVAVEMFRRLGRTPHRLDPHPGPLAGRFSRTMPGGFADLRSPRGAELAGTAFDEFHHTPDFRRHSGTTGLHNIPKVALRLYRIPAFKVAWSSPRQRTPNTFTFDPSGRDVPLFMPRSRPEAWDRWRQAEEWEVPAPMRCRVLGHAEYEIEEGLILDLVQTQALPQSAANQLRTVSGRRFRSERALSQALDELAAVSTWLNAVRHRALLKGALVADCGKQALVPNAVTVRIGMNEVERELIEAGDLSDWAVTAPGKRAVIDPEIGRLLFIGAAPTQAVTVTYHYGFPGRMGAGTYDRRDAATGSAAFTHQNGGPIAAASVAGNGLTRIADNGTYSVGTATNKADVRAMVLAAANQRRPLLRLTSEWRLDTGANTESTLVMDGLWITSDGGTEIVLRGDYEIVTIRRCTLDPGGLTYTGATISPVRLIVEGQVERVVVDRSVTGPIRARGAGIVERVEIRDSIVQSRVAGLEALRFTMGQVELERTTVFGEADVHRLSSTDSLITGPVDVTDTQAGCFRFSAAPSGSRVPRPYESFLFEDSAHYFTSRLFGQPGYGQLSETAPAELSRGAENGSEMGAFSGLHNPIKLDGLQTKVDEYLPFGLIPAFVNDT